ncbi:TPM domain-containing protein [Mucilaginibacter sp.]|uniref:TPM domain-containing protein n=1 Tax=Mucilaginibacter sp. TaxID=1882438 RepID=UPI003D0E8339
MFKKLILFFSFLLIGFLAIAQQIPPKPTTLVNDYTVTLSRAQVDALEKKLVAFNDSTSTQIAVVIVRTVDGSDINDYGQKLGRAWGIGTKGKNNGILVLVAVGDRKISIQTGYGAEGAVPDIITHQIINNDITPRFKEGDYYGGLDAGTDDLMKYMKGEYKGNKKAKADDGGGVGGFIILIIIVVVILIIIFRKRGGGGGQIYDSRGGASPFWWFLGGAMLGRSSGGWGGFSNGDGGFGGGSSDSGGSFGDSGGFGGGDFGGGGSSGSW